MDYKTYFENLKDKKVAVLGIGVSNTPLIKMLVKYGAKVTACDLKKTEKEIPEEIKNIGVEFALGESYLDNLDHDVIFKSPGIRCDVPQLIKAVQNGSVLTSEMEVFFDLCPAPIFAITGSDGKTTTTTLTYEILKAEGYTCHLGGNIGKPLLPEIENIKATDKVVVELSSFQLHTMKKSPHCAVITNLAPNHLDWHIDMDEYIESKKNIYKFQNSGDRLVTNADNDITKIIADENTKSLTFSRKTVDSDIYLEDGFICYKGEKILDIDTILLPGEHNIENYMAAIGAVYEDVSIESIRYVAENFAKIPHRIEFIREYNGVKFYNDSIASSPSRSIAGLKSFDRKVIMIAGGYDKKIPYDCIGEIINDKVKKLVLCGATSPKIEAAVKNADNYNNLPIVTVSEFKDILNEALKDAETGDIVILSPASASFDLFKNFEERGNVFKDMVNAL